MGLNQARSSPACHLTVASHNLIAKRVDGAEHRDFLTQRSEQRLIAVLHINRAGLRKGDGQDLSWQDAMAENHVGNPRGHHCCLSCPGNSQQQHRTIDCLDGLALLLCQANRVFLLQIVQNPTAHHHAHHRFALLNVWRSLPDSRFFVLRFPAADHPNQRPPPWNEGLDSSGDT